jgi:alkylation response protein AidB-like acyl-CoA dehydrogenase
MDMLDRFRMTVGAAAVGYARRAADAALSWAGIVDAAVQILGAAGLVRDSVPERLYRQVRALRIHEGTTEVQKTVIAAAIDLRHAKRPRSAPPHPLSRAVRQVRTAHGPSCRRSGR